MCLHIDMMNPGIPGVCMMLVMMMTSHPVKAPPVEMIFDGRDQSLTSMPEEIPHNTTTILLQQNRIFQLECAKFYGLLQVSKLNLGENQLSTIPPACFGSLINLQYLYLDSNNISVLTNSSLLQMTKLVLLNLNNNYLVELPPGFFADLISITRLELEKNVFTGE